MNERFGRAYVYQNSHCEYFLYQKSSSVPKPFLESVAVRLAGGDVLQTATAGMPDCYRGAKARASLKNSSRIRLKIVVFTAVSSEVHTRPVAVR
jgi:hypothetical protein